MRSLSISLDKTTTFSSKITLKYFKFEGKESAPTKSRWDKNEQNLKYAVIFYKERETTTYLK